MKSRRKALSYIQYKEERPTGLATSYRGTAFQNTLNETQKE